MDFVRAAKKTLGRKKAAMVQEFSDDGYTYEVVLRAPFANMYYGGETTWIFDYHFYDDMTDQEVLSDLASWINGVEKVSPEVWTELTGEAA